jgi:predicted DNA-binding transcriptional regulator AlpA
MEQATMESLVKARVVGERLGMAQSQVYRLARNGTIPSYLVGEKKGGVRFDLREVREALRRKPAEEVGK